MEGIIGMASESIAVHSQLVQYRDKCQTPGFSQPLVSDYGDHIETVEQRVKESYEDPISPSWPKSGLFTIKLNFWCHSRAKVRSFLDMMENFDLHSPLPSPSTSSSSSSSSTSNLHPLSISAEGWEVGEKVTHQILSVIQPTVYSETRRKEIVEYVQTLIEDHFGIKVFPFGSVPLKTYLPHGDVDLTAVCHHDSSQDLASDIWSLLQNEEKNNCRIQVRDVLCVPAQVRIVKCTVDNISVDISFNQTAGLCALLFLEQVDQLIGKDHLFKRSMILIKAWCYYESRLLGGFHGLISTYALETMVLHVINRFHSSLHCPLAVLYKFLEYYSTFDWETYCIGINGLVLISSLPEIVVQPPHVCDELLLKDDFLRSSREALFSFNGVVRTEKPAFLVKFLNVLDPLRDDNNLGRSVSKGNFYRIKSALSYGSKKMGDILMLPPEKIRKGLENFFVNTLGKNGRGKRADVLVPVPEYGAGISDISVANGEKDTLLAGIQYGLWFQDYGMMYPVPPDISATPHLWNNGWSEMGQNLQYDQNMYYNVDESPPSSVDSPKDFHLPYATFVEEKWKSRGTGPFIPNLEHLLRRDIDLQESRKEEEEIGKDVETVESQACSPTGANVSSDVFNFSVEEFPVLPGTKPIPIKVNPFGSQKFEPVKETLASSMDSLEFGSLKCSSPISISLSEPCKQSDSDVSVILDSPIDPTMAIEEDLESSKSEEKLAVTVEPLQLTDEKEFPSLSPSPKPDIRFNKKEFPPLGSYLKSDKRMEWKKNIQKVQKAGQKKEVNPWCLKV